VRIRDGTSTDTLTVSEQTRLLGSTNADTIEARSVAAVEVRCDTAHVGVMEGVDVHARNLTTDSLAARSMCAERGEFTYLDVHGCALVELQTESATIARATLTDLVAHAAITDTLTARVVASTHTHADVVTAQELLTVEASASTLHAGHVQTDTLSSGVVRAREAELDSVLALRATFLHRLEAPDVLAERARLERLDADTAQVLDLSADRMKAGVLTATCAIEAPLVRADNATVGSAACDVVVAERLSAASATITALTSTTVEAGDVLAEAGRFGSIVTDRWTGARACIDEVQVSTLDTGDLTCIGHASFVDLQTQNILMEAAEAQNVRVAGLLHTGRLCAEHVAVTSVDAATVVAERLVAGDAAVDRVTAAEARLEKLEAKFADLERAHIRDLLAERIEASGLTTDARIHRLSTPFG
jgi:hypothetical protein